MVAETSQTLNRCYIMIWTVGTGIDEKSQTLIGRSTGKKYQVGDKLDAILKEVSPLTGGLLFKPK